MPEKWVLRQYQALPLTAKVHMSQARIREWYDHWEGNVCISFSGGKDSTVLAHVVHDLYPKVPLVFVNTGLEYPEIQSFARKMGAEFIRPKMRFDEVISKYGYPIISKENAEAIHYARKICNGGGYKGNEVQTGKHDRSSVSLYQGRTGWRRATLTGKPLSKSEGGGTIPQPIRMRLQLNGKYGGIRAGVAQIGINGDESVSPG